MMKVLRRVTLHKHWQGAVVLVAGKMIIYVCLCLILQSVAESTDLALTFHNEILILRNVESKLPVISETVQYYHSNGQQGYPVGLAYNATSHSLLVADVHDNVADIRAIKLGNSEPVEASPIVEKYGTSIIEAIIYDSQQDILLWNDPFKNSIYFSNKEDKYLPKLIHKSDTLKPRGLAYNTCDREIFWSNRGEYLPGIFRSTLDGVETPIVQPANEKTFYQGIAFDSHTNELWWAETTSESSKDSNCIISVHKDGHTKILTHIPKCYPFSLVLDDMYLYWSDWSRGAIMRMSRTDSADFVSIFNTPSFHDANDNTYHGAYGMVILNKIITKCTEEQTMPHESLIREEKNMEASNIMFKKSDQEYATPNQQDVTKDLTMSQPLKKAVIREPLTEDSTDMPNFIQSPMYQSFNNTQETTTLNLSDYLNFITFGLATLCILMTVLICIVLMKMRKKNNDLVRTISAYKEQFGPINLTKDGKLVKTHRRFGPNFLPKKPPCTDDGVHIDIENCCQMTLCERPCFTSITREGKSYITPSTMKEDKVKLLDDPLL